jgi:TonB family protein
MRIGFAGRIGTGIVLFAVGADAATWIIRAFDNYPFDFYRLTDAYLPFAFIVGLGFLLPAISGAIQQRRAANLAEFPLTSVGPLPSELRQASSPGEPRSEALRASSVDGHEIPPPELAFVPSPSYRHLFKRVGLACILAALILYGGVHYSVATRIFVPLDVVISPVHGHNRTTEFRTNFRAVYLVDLDVPFVGEPDCRLWYSPHAIPIHWQLLRSGRLVAAGIFDKSKGYPYGGFGRVEIPSGLYTVDIDIPQACTFGHLPSTLKVEVDREGFNVARYTDVLFYLLAALGVTLLIWPEIRETEELSLQDEARATFRGMAQVDRTPQLAIPVAKPLSILRVWSTALITVLAVVWIIFVITNTPRTRRGLLVHVPKPGTYALANEPWDEPLVVRIDAEHNYYFRGRPVSLSQLGPMLQRTLVLRSDWTVYVDADPDTNAGEVIRVADLVIGIGNAKVYLVTPSMKKEKPAVFATPPCELKALEAKELPVPPQKNRRGAYHPLVSFVVMERGGVSNVRIVRGSGDAEIDAWAIKSVRKWKYAAKPGCGSREQERYLNDYYSGW